MLGGGAGHQRPHVLGFHLYEMSGVGKSTEAESRPVAAGAGGVGNNC